MLPRSGASAILEGGNVAHLSQSMSPSVSTLSSKPAACRQQRKKKHGSAALHLRDDGLSITGRAIRNESGQLARLPPGHAARHARQLQRPQSGRWARRRARETCRGRSVRSSTSYIGAHPAPSILTHLTFALAFRPLMQGRATAQFTIRVRSGTRASVALPLLIDPLHRDSLASIEDSAARPGRAGAVEFTNEAAHRRARLAPPSAHTVSRQRVPTAARERCPPPRIRTPAGTRRAANTPLVLEPLPRVGYGKRRRAHSHALVAQYGQSTLMSYAAFWSTDAGPSLPSQRIAQVGTPLAEGTRCRTPLQYAPLLEEQELHRRASHAARSPTVHLSLRSHRSTTGSARPAAPGRDPTASG